MIIYTECPQREFYTRFVARSYTVRYSSDSLCYLLEHSKDGACRMTAHTAIVPDPFQNARPCWLREPVPAA